MKNLLILLCLFTFAQGAEAQANKGAVVATGSFGYSASDTKSKNNGGGSSYYRYNFSPQVGYLVSDKLEVGLFAVFQKDDSQNESYISVNLVEYSEFKTTSKAVGAYLSKYVFLTDKVALTGKGEVLYSTHNRSGESYKNQDGMDYDKFTSRNEDISFVADIRPGLSFFLSEKISLNSTFGSLSFTSNTVNDESWQEVYQNEWIYHEFKRNSNTIKLDLSSTSYTLGLSYFF